MFKFRISCLGYRHCCKTKSATTATSKYHLQRFHCPASSLLSRSDTIQSSFPNNNNDVTGPSEAYRADHARSISNPEEYWGEAAEQIIWFKKYNKVLDTKSRQQGKWFCGGELNTCYNAIDRHVEAGYGEQTAIIYDSPVTGKIQSFSYKKLQENVSKLAGVLVSMGVSAGDRVLIYMPMIPEAIYGMLACARIGAVHVFVFGGFAAKELSTRIRHTEPKVILSASCGIEPTRVVRYKPILDEAIRLVDLPFQVKCLIYQRERAPAELKPGRDLDWNEAVQRVNKGHNCVPVDSDHPLYIMYTSGTTGMPKGIVRATGGHTVVLPWSLKTVYNMKSEEIWWAVSDLGWVVGHSYICYGPLLSRLTSVLYEGKPVGTPDAAQFYRVIEEHGVNGMFTAPTSMRAIRKEDPDNEQAKNYSRKSLKHLFLAGERCDNDTKIWAQKSFQVQAIDHFWQTESGHAMTAICTLFDSHPHTRPPVGTGGVPLPGYQMEIRLNDGSLAEPGELGRLVCKLPMPPGFMKTLYKSDDLCLSTYFQKYPGYYDTMDAGYIDEHGYVHIMARDDDVINVAGHRLSTSSIEEAILEHDQIADVAVVGVPDSMKGQVALALYVIVPGSTVSEETITSDLIKLVRETLGPVVAFRLAASVPSLPRTRSGKTPRKSIAELAVENSAVKIPPTIEEANDYTHVIHALNKLGYAKNSKVIH